jgi:hypothetical protein
MVLQWLFSLAECGRYCHLPVFGEPRIWKERLLGILHYSQTWRNWAPHTFEILQFILQLRYSIDNFKLFAVTFNSLLVDIWIRSRCNIIAQDGPPSCWLWVMVLIINWKSLTCELDVRFIVGSTAPPTLHAFLSQRTWIRTCRPYRLLINKRGVCIASTSASPTINSTVVTNRTLLRRTVNWGFYRFKAFKFPHLMVNGIILF